MEKAKTKIIQLILPMILDASISDLEKIRFISQAMDAYLCTLESEMSGLFTQEGKEAIETVRYDAFVHRILMILKQG